MKTGRAALVSACLLVACAGGASITPGTPQGTWSLVQSLQRHGDTIESRDPAARESVIVAWLAGDDRTRLADARDTVGLTLRIGADGRFQEQRVASSNLALWCDEDGVERMDDAAPFDGHVVPRGDAHYLRPDLPTDAMAVRLERDARFPGIALRIDDGDALLADRIEVDGDRLLRTMSVVYDDAYPARLTLVYRRAD